MNIFEYKTVSASHPPDMETELNNLGKNGWELVSVVSNPQLGSSKYALVGFSISMVAVLKRKREKRNGDN